jgi:hypothetical protein
LACILIRISASITISQKTAQEVNMFLHSDDNLLINFSVTDFVPGIIKKEKLALFAYIRRDYDFKNQTDVLKNILKSLRNDIKIYLLNEESVAAIDWLDIGGSPTFVLFYNGTEKGRLLGKTDEKTLTGFLTKHLS